jgi:hypothetical protein
MNLAQRSHFSILMMRRSAAALLRRHWWGSLAAALGALPSPAAAGSVTVGSDSLQLSGFVSATYQSATQDVNHVIVGRLFSPNQNQFTLETFELGLDRLVPTDRRAAGFSVRMLYGSGATYTKSAGLDLGPQADLTQALATVNFPTRTGNVLISAGKMASMMGLEVIESTLNPNLSVGNQFIFIEDFTHLGLDVNWTINPHWSTRWCVVNGWDAAVDNNQSSSAMGRVGFAPDAKTNLAALGYYGPEQAGNSSDARYGGEFLGSRAIGPHSLTVQLDDGRDDAVSATWWGAGAWLTLGLSSGTTLALRADVLDDSDGARTSGALGYPALSAQRLSSLTATLNLRPATGILVRPEIRYDHSDQTAFDGHGDQMTFAIGAACTY